MRELVKRAKADEEARLTILRSFEPLIKKCIKRYVRDYTYYQDAMQQGYMVILSCIKNYDIDSKYHFEAYLKMSLIYAIRDFSKKIKYDVSFDNEINDDGGTLLDIIDGGVDILGDIAEDETLRELKEALHKLPEKQREVIEDFYLRNISMMEICKGRRCHYMSVVKLKERGIRNLRDIMRNIK